MSSLGHGKRSFTGHHSLLPASRDRSTDLFVPIVPTRSFISWTFGRGTVVWRIWPAVLLHTAFAAIIVSISMKTKYKMNVPPILLTVLGVVIGFVISYRAMSGYDRYWMGRTSWSDVVHNARSLGRIIWFHVPCRVSPRTPEEIASGISNKRSKEEMTKVMNEKRMALDLIEGFVVAVKHHLRGELGIYYEDLYHLVRPLHEHGSNHDKPHHHQVHEDVVTDTAHRSPSPTSLRPPPIHTGSHSRRKGSASTSTAVDAADHHAPLADPVVPSITAYGTFDPSTQPRPSARPVSRQSGSSSRGSSQSHETRALLPSQLLDTSNGIFAHVSRELIPFESFFHWIHGLMSRKPKLELPINGSIEGEHAEDGAVEGRIGDIGRIRKGSHGKHRPRVAGGGQNLPLAILRCMSEWLSVLDDRNTMNGNANAGIYTYINNFEDNLSALERILTTPLPFVYSVHIRHTVWIYLFFLPFQLIDQFGWTAIPGVGIAAFIYLGFLAAGEEIEQPFGYDENDLDLDLFCQEIVHKDIDQLKGIQCLNCYFSHAGPDLVHRSIVETSVKIPKDEQEQDVFGTLI